jgi:hypothetical protein
VSDLFAGVTSGSYKSGSNGYWTAGTEFNHPSGQFFSNPYVIAPGVPGTAVIPNDVISGPAVYKRWIEVDLGEARSMDWSSLYADLDSNFDADGNARIYASNTPMPAIDPTRDCCMGGAPYADPVSEGWTEIAGPWTLGFKAPGVPDSSFRLFEPTGGPTAAFRYWIVLSEITSGGLGSSGESITEWLAESTAPPPPEPKVDIDVHDPDGVFISAVPDAYNKRFRVEKDGTGQFSFSINRHSPYATALILARDNVVKYTINLVTGGPHFAGFLEVGDFDLNSIDEQGGEELRFGGRGLLSYLERDVAWTTSYVLVTEPTDGYWRFAPVTMPSWSTGNEPGQILKRIIDEMQDPDRPQHCMDLMAVDFDYEQDTDGNPWASTDATNPVWTVAVGENVLTTLGRLIATGVLEVQMDPSFLLHAYNHYGRDLTGDDFGAGVVRFVKGANIADRVNRQWSGQDIAPYELVAGDDGHYIRAELPDAATRVQKVVFNQFTGTNNPTLEALGLADLEQRLVRADSAAFAVTTRRAGGTETAAGGRYLPGPPGTSGDYWVGDLVRLVTGTTDIDYDEQDVRVAAISVAEIDAGNLIVIPELGSATGQAMPEFGGTYGDGGGIAVAPGSTGGTTGTPSHGSLPGRAADEQHPAAAVSYDNGASGLAADDVQAALDEIAAGGGFVTVDNGGGETIKAHPTMGAAETFDPADGNLHTGTLTTDCTVTLAAPVGAAGATLEAWITQDGTGGHAISFVAAGGGTFLWDGATPTPDTSAGVTVRYLLERVPATSNDWVGNLAGGGGSSVAALDDLSDVTITGPAVADRLRYDGSQWVNTTLTWEVMVDYTGSVMLDSAGNPSVHEVAY